jgi:hypothetical protein
MPRPQINLEDIELPSIDTPMGDFAEQACGLSYHTGFAVHQAYKGVDEFTYELKAHSDYWDTKPGSEMSGDELAAMAPRATNAANAIVSAQRMLDGKDPSLPVKLVAGGGKLGAVPTPGVKVVVDPKNLQAIQHLIDRATYYGTLGTQLWNYWAKEYQPKVLKEYDTPGREWGIDYIQTQMPHWPLDQTRSYAMVFCSTAEPGEEVTASSPSWKAKVECPNLIVESMHSGDAQLFEELMRAAMIWARCAEEAAGVVGLHYLNKDLWESQQGPGGLVFAPDGGGTPPPDGPGIVDPGAPPPPPPEPPVIGDFDPPAPVPPDGEPIPLPDPNEPGPLPDPNEPPGEGPGEGEEPDGPLVQPEDDTPARRGFAGLSTPVKIAVIGGLGYLGYRALTK